MIKGSFYIPAVNLMHIKLTNTIKALCFGTTRCYFESSSLSVMLDLTATAEDDDTITMVGDIDKVKLRDGRIVYRQRMYFLRIESLVTLCKTMNVGINLTDDIYITSRSMTNMQKDLPYLYKYASDLGMNVTDWLLLVFKYYWFLYLKHKDILHLSEIDESYFAEIETRYGVLNRAPYFLSVCDILKHKFIILQYFDIDNAHLYTLPEEGTASFYSYGFTNVNVLSDKRKGVFCENKS